MVKRCRKVGKICTKREKCLGFLVKIGIEKWHKYKNANFTRYKNGTIIEWVELTR